MFSYILDKNKTIWYVFHYIQSNKGVYIILNIKG